MKHTLLFLLVFLNSLSAFAINEGEVNQILLSRGLSIDQVHAQGMQIYMGENSGHIPFAKLKVLITDQEAILSHEIDSVDMSGSTVSGIKSVRFNGRYILKSDIKAVVSEN